MHTTFYFLFIGAATAFFVYGFFLAMFFETLHDTTPANADVAAASGLRQKVVTLRAICFVAFVTSLLPFLAWELRFGSAFSYVWPTHGLARIDDYTWRVGVFLKAVFLASIIALLASFLAGDSVGDFAEHFNTTELPVLSRLSYVDALLVPVCIAFPIIAALIYTAVPNTGNKIK